MKGNNAMFYMNTISSSQRCSSSRWSQRQWFSSYCDKEIRYGVT